MPPITFDTNQVPEGTYLTRFKGVKVVSIKNPRTAQTEERYEWRFQIFGGPNGGRDITQLSGLQATSVKTTAFKMMAFLLGRMPTQGEAVDPDQFVDRWYKVKWKVNPESETKRCHIADVEAAAAPDPGRPSMFPPKPPARPGRPAPQAQVPIAAGFGPPEVRYWVCNEGDEEEPKLLTETEVRALVNSGDMLRLTDEAQTKPWAPAEQWGFKQDIPF